MNNLATPNYTLELQKTLHAKAKREPNCRFYSLYDKIYRKDVLEHAWRCCRRNGGAAGIDEQTFEQIEAEGLERWLGLLAEELRKKSYKPQPIRRVFIPKPNGKQRPLGIATIRDRVVQMVVAVLLSPIFEADLPEEQYGYRSGRNAHDAIRKIYSLICAGHKEIVDADLSSYFDTIPHPELMRCLRRRICDGALLKLIKAWLKCPTAEANRHGRSVLSNTAKREKRGTPQGSPLSPVLSNIYMRRFILGWKKLGYEQRFSAHIVSYADDFVICCRGRGKSHKARAAMTKIMERLKLTVNEEKTHLCNVWERDFDFLGYTFGVRYSWRNAKAFMGTRPSAKRVSAICQEISELASHATKNLPEEVMLKRLNQVLNGWANYFSLGVCSPAYGAIDRHSRYRVRQWIRAKYKLGTVPKAKYTDGWLHNTLGLAKLQGRKRIFSNAKA